MQARMDGAVTHPFGDSATVTFAPPAALTVAGFTVWRHEAVTASQPFGSPATNRWPHRFRSRALAGRTSPVVRVRFR